MSLRNSLFSGLFIFLMLAVVVGLVNEHFNVEFGKTDFFEVHGYFFLLFITLFPRLTLLFSSVATGGVFWWIGFFVCPRVLIALLATISYFYTNPLLVVLSWMIALSGELLEKMSMRRRAVFINLGGRQKKYYAGSDYPKRERAVDSEDIIEAEFKKLDDD